MTLVDVNIDEQIPEDPLMRLIAGGTAPRRLAEGVYAVGHFNFNYTLQNMGVRINEYPFDEYMDFENLTVEERLNGVREAFADETRPSSSYGVCDSWMQLVEKYPRLLEDERRFVISVTEIRHEDQPESGGWRWHKWGEYIGEYEPQHEYLYDEKDIDSVWCFHIYEVLS